MLAYFIGVFLGAALQPSTIIVLILSLILSESKKSFIIILLIILCIAQWILKAVLGSPYLSFWPVIVSFLIGYFLILIIYSQKRKNKTKSNEISKEEKGKIRQEYIKKTIYLFIFFILIILLYNFTPFKKVFQKSETKKEIYEGYTQVEIGDLPILKFNNAEFEKNLMQFVHYDFQIKKSKEIDLIPNYSLLNPIFQKCVNNQTYDIQCLSDENANFFGDESCLWTFRGYSTIVSIENYYLLNVAERACGSMVGDSNSFYLVEYNGRFFEILDYSILPFKSLQRKIEHYKVNEDGISIITETCYLGADTCNGIKPDFLELKF